MDYEDDDGFEELDPERRAELSRRSAELLVRAERTHDDDDEAKDLRRAATRELLARVRATLAAPRPEGDPWTVPLPTAASAPPVGSSPRFVAKVTVAPPPSSPSAAWKAWIRAEISKYVKGYADAIEPAVAKFTIEYVKKQHASTNLSIAEFEQRIARLEAAQLKAAQLKAAKPVAFSPLRAVKK